MKFKFLSILMAVAVALAFSSCGEKSGSGTEEKVPSGDPVKDAKAYVEKELSLMEGVKSPEDFKKAQEEFMKFENEIKDIYKDKREELAKFQEERMKLMSSDDYKDKYEKARKKLDDIMREASKKANEEMKEAASAAVPEEMQAAEAVEDMEEAVAAPAVEP